MVVFGEFSDPGNIMPLGVVCKNIASLSDPLYVVLNVENEGVYSLTQQMSALGHDHGPLMESENDSSIVPTRAQPIATPRRGLPTATPFCSPTGYGIFGGSPMV